VLSIAGGAALAVALLNAAAGSAASVPEVRLSPQSVPFTVGSFHGGYVLSASALRAIAAPGPTSLSDEAVEQEPPALSVEAKAGVCARRVCGESPGPAVRLKASPAPTTAPFDCCGNIDPQIAASDKSYLVVGMRQSVWFYDKAGRPLLKRKPSISRTEKPPTAPGSPLATFGEIKLCDLFAPMIPDVNRHLGLPTQKTDAEGHRITVRNGYGINCDAKTGGMQPPNWQSDRDFYWPDDEIYDARVMWDEFHKRFWIVGLFKNSNTVAFPDPATEDPMMLRPATRSANVRSARRALLAIAVSKTDDPRDGWRLGWTWGVPGESACPACPGFGSDYLAMGISSKYVTLESAGGTIDERGRRTITIIPTAPLVHGSDAPVYQPDREQLGTRLFQPAVQHGPNIDGGKDVFLATPIYDKDGGLAGDAVQLTVIAPAGAGSAAPDLYQQDVPVTRFHAVWSTDSSGHVSGAMLAPQRPGPGVTGHPTLSVAQNWVNKLVSRGHDLYLTMDECRQWTAPACAFSAVRYLRIHLGALTRSHGRITHVATTVVDDRTVSGSNRSRPTKSIWFGFPAVDVDAKGDAVISYDGTGPSVFPQARYSVWLAHDSDVRSSRVLKKGLSTLGSPPDWQAGWHHYLGMSVDTFDGRGIWLVNGYASSSHSWSFAIGKVLGRRIADIAVVRAAVVRAGGSGSHTYRVTFDVADLGDGAAPARSARIALTRPESPDVPLGSVAVPKVRSGHRLSFSLVVTAPPVAGYDVIGVSLPTIGRPEYDTGNDNAYVSLPH
jgi:hypothetical protein